MLEQLTERFAKLKERITDISKSMSEQVSFTDFELQRKATEEKLSYRIDHECSRLRKLLELRIQDLGQSVLDCLKRRDQQLDRRLQALQPFISTPIQPMNTNTVTNSLRDQTYSLQSNTLPVMDSSNQYNPPVKLEFPSFSNSPEEDPILFIERREEYFAVRPLKDSDILASLTAVLKSTAKDWWMAERGNVHDWKQFKELFLQSFLSEDYEEVAIRKLMERRQGARESFRDFAFHYRALCLRWKKGMSEREVVQYILRNCNPRLTSLLACYVEISKT